MTAPTSPSPDSLAAVVAELRAYSLGEGPYPPIFSPSQMADRIERLDAEMRERLVDARQQRTIAWDAEGVLRQEEPPRI